MENSVDPDQMASKKPSDQDLHCFNKCAYQVSVGNGLSVVCCC